VLLHVSGLHLTSLGCTQMQLQLPLGLKRHREMQGVQIIWKLVGAIASEFGTRARHAWRPYAVLAEL